MQALPDESRTLSEWHDEFEGNPEIDERFVTYAEWLETVPSRPRKP